jgi:hypothetical protein
MIPHSDLIVSAPTMGYTCFLDWNRRIFQANDRVLLEDVPVTFLRPLLLLNKGTLTKIESAP